MRGGAGDGDRRALGRQRVAGGGVGELGHRGDVAGRHLGDRDLLLAAQGEQGVQPLVVVGARVGEHGVGLIVPESTLNSEILPT